MVSQEILLLFLLFGSVSCDRLKFHLENLVDRNISACDDFYHHACSQQVDPNEFFTHQSTFSLNEAIKRLYPEVIKHSPIEFDLQHSRNDKINKEDNNYEKLARLRCKEDINCYMHDHEYYIELIHNAKENYNITDLPTGETIEESIKNYIKDTSRIIENLIDFINSPDGLDRRTLFNRSMSFHDNIQTRIRLIEFVKSNNTYTDFHEIKEVAETMKTKMIDMLNSTAWLHEDEISKFILLKLKERVSKIEILHDFDQFENITTLQKFIRDLNKEYFSVKSGTGIHRLDTILRLSSAYIKIEKNILSQKPELKQFFFRVYSNFQLNAFFEPELKTVTMLAPYIRRSSFKSNILKEPFITYSCLGHELYHSLFATHTKNLLNLYGERLQCIINHYNQSCSKFALGACASGKHTITEDGPDLESLRLSYSLLRELYSDDELKNAIDGLGTTREQAFFYYASSEFCAKSMPRTEEQAKEDVHSADNVRINAALSLMPEFTRAFSCKKGDAMYAEEKDSCYVFGPKS